MAISEAERLSAFECLGLTYGPGAGANEDTAHIHTGFGSDLILSEMDDLRDAVNVYLNNLAAAPLLKVQAIVVEWDLVANSVVALDGGVGDLSGVSYSSQAKRDQLRAQMLIYVPVMHIQEALKRRAGPSERGSVGFIR